MACQSYHNRLVNTWHLRDQREVYRITVERFIESLSLRCRKSIHRGFTGWWLRILYSAEKAPYFTHFSQLLSFIWRGLLHQNRQSVHTNAMHMIVPQVMSEQCISANARCHVKKELTKRSDDLQTPSCVPCLATFAFYPLRFHDPWKHFSWLPRKLEMLGESVSWLLIA